MKGITDVQKAEIVSLARKAGLLVIFDERELAVIEGRFPEQGKAQTFQKLGDRFQVTRERISQIEDKSIRQLHLYLQKKNIPIPSLSQNTPRRSGTSAIWAQGLTKAGKIWTYDEDDLLIKEYEVGRTVEELSKLHLRTRLGIVYRLVYLKKLPEEAIEEEKRSRLSK